MVLIKLTVMKTVILFFILILTFEINAQLTANAGDDTVFCYQLNGTNTYSIGGSPTASNGVPPYTFEWSIAEPYNPWGSVFFNSDDFLDDTTSANPTIIDGFGTLDSMMFFLKVTDLLGNSAQDSVRIGFSNFTYSMENNFFHLLEGDTVFYPGASYVSGGLGALTYLWQPNYGLIDSTSNLLWANPSVSTDYFCTVTDEFGCSSEPLVMNHVIVHYLTVNEIDNNNTSLDVFPNPTDGEIFIKSNSKEVKNIFIYDSNMKLIDKLSSIIGKYDLSNLEKGNYFIAFELNGEIQFKKIVKE